MLSPLDPETILRALENLLAFTDATSREDQRTDARLREEYRAVRDDAETIAAAARAVLRQAKRRA
jgi:hypothetical protein